MHRIDDLEPDEISFVIRDHHAVIQTSDAGDVYVESTARAPGGLAFRHEAGPDQAGLVVERQYAPRKQSLRPLRPREPGIEQTRAATWQVGRRQPITC